MKLATSSKPVALAAAAALTGIVWSDMCVAATGLDEECPSSRQALVSELALPSLQVDVVEYSDTEQAPAADSSVARPLADSELQTSALLRRIAPTTESDGAETADTREEPAVDLPPTTTRIPGVADEHLPRFRRQMFRTDI